MLVPPRTTFSSVIINIEEAINIRSPRRAGDEREKKTKTFI